MVDILSERRMVENETVFRTYNESVIKRFDELSDIAKEEGQEAFVKRIAISDIPLYFYCECADENCHKRVRLKPSEYTEIHKQRDHFVLVPGHEVEAIEKVVGKESGFCIVEKLLQPPEKALVLYPTEVNNT